MAYTPTNWITGDVITATKLNNAETGIDDAHDLIDDLQEQLDAENINRIYGVKW